MLPSSYSMAPLLLSKNVRNKIRHKTTVLPIIFHGCETWSLTIREHSFSVEEKVTQTTPSKGPINSLPLNFKIL